MASKPAQKKAQPKKPAARKTAAGFVAARAVPLALTMRQQRFVDEYMVDLNGKQAAIRAGYSAVTAEQIAYQLIQKTSVLAAIAAARKAQQERTQIDADRVVLEAWHIATADTRELVQVKLGCCRHCWGEGHKRQRTLAEFNSEREKHRAKGEADTDWDDQGGIGFNPLRDPHAACPECHGDGAARVVLGDTRKLSGAALALFAGAKQGKHGIEVQMHSKMDALEKLAKHFGLYEKDNQQKTDPLASLLHAIASGSGNGFAPVAADPERAAPAEKPSAFKPVQNPLDD